MSYSIPCYFQVTECCMNTSSKFEVKNHNKILNLKSTKAYQIITDNKEKQLVKSVDLCHIFLIKVTKTRLISGNYCCINHTTINQMTNDNIDHILRQELLCSCRHEYLLSPFFNPFDNDPFRHFACIQFYEF